MRIDCRGKRVLIEIGKDETSRVGVGPGMVRLERNAQLYGYWALLHLP